MRFWAELECKRPKMTKLTTLTRELMKVIVTTKANYEKLIKINGKDMETLQQYGGFLSTFSDTSEDGSRLISKANA